MTDSTFDSSVLDALLVRYLDGELDSDQTARIEQELGNEAVARRLWELRSETRRFSDALEAVSTPPPPPLATPMPHRARPRLRAVAAVAALLLFAGVAAALPVTRGLVAAGLHRVVTWVAEKKTSPAPADAREGHAIVSIPFEGRELKLDVRGLAVPATVRIESTDGHAVRVTAPGAALLVLPGGVRVRPTGGDFATVTVAIPESVSTLRIRTDRGERVVDLRAGGLPREIPVDPNR